MSRVRVIFAFLLTIALVASMSPGTPPTVENDGHACCKADPGSRPAPKHDCDGGPCAMQCCRIIPASLEAAPELTDWAFVIETAVVPPARFHSLSEPQAIFHPPRV